MLALRRTLAVLGALVAVAVVVGAVLAYLTFGTGQPVATATPASTEAPLARIIARSMASPDAPASFKDRPAFRSCGHIEVPQGGVVPAASIACLSGTSAQGRELVVVSRTTEGDRIVRYFRTGPDIDGVEIFEDATGDRFDGSWHDSLCRSGQIDQFGACA